MSLLQIFLVHVNETCGPRGVRVEAVTPNSAPKPASIPPLPLVESSHNVPSVPFSSVGSGSADQFSSVGSLRVDRLTPGETVEIDLKDEDVKEEENSQEMPLQMVETPSVLLVQEMRLLARDISD